MKKLWKKGRGRLGPLAPLHGKWIAKADSPMGPLTCLRSFEPILGGSYLQLKAKWLFGAGATDGYQELAIIGADKDGAVVFWSFTSDGKSSRGTLVDMTDVHPEAVGFEAEMPAGLARMVYWPDEDGGFHWIVESKTKKGWNRFVEHRYQPDLSESAD